MTHMRKGRWWLLVLALVGVQPGVFANPWVRVPNETLRFPEQLGGYGYRLVDRLGIEFDQPAAMAFPPANTNAILVAELPGRIVAVTNRSAPSRTVVLDLTSTTVTGPNEGLLSLVLHPEFASNGRIFLLRMARFPSDGTLKYNQLSEIQVSPETFQVVSGEEEILIRQLFSSRDHAGGDLQFGPDGYLYVSLGDGFFPEVNSQQIDRDFFSALLRIDVDQRPGSLPPNPHPAVVGNYWIPPDNPYVGVTQFLGSSVDPGQVRTEFWSVGWREPFRMAFDSHTGALWVGDVGNNTHESVFVTTAGANHGWPYREGRGAGILFNTVPPDFLENPAYQYTPPVFTYTHAIGACVVGGVVYRGNQLPELFGGFLVADYSYGWVGVVRANDQDGEIMGLALYRPKITDFAEDPIDKEVWVAEIDRSRLWRLERAPEHTGEKPPATLAETGAFTDLERLTPAPGIIPYEVNHPFWSDHATKQRWVSIPDVTQSFGFHGREGWSAPAGTVWIKHFELELTNGVPASARRLETRFVIQQVDGIYGVTYRWDSPTNATLVPEGGLDEDIVRVVDGVSTVQRWRYPSRSECLACHNRVGGFALSFNTAQLNRDIEANGIRTNQIAALLMAGYLTNSPPSLFSEPRLAARDEEQASLEWRVRSYLAANCSFCHQPGGSGWGQFDARLLTSTDAAGLLNGPLLNNRGDASNRVIVPGDLAHSVLLQRSSTRGAGQMPPLASTVADAKGAALLAEWIESLGGALPPEPEVHVRAVTDTNGFRLLLTQPANRVLHLEMKTELTNEFWTPMDVPATGRIFPATAREVEIPLPESAVPVFYRVRTEAP